MPLKCKNMAEKQDIAMNEFPVVTDLSYLYGEKSNSSQVKIKVSDLLSSIFQYRGPINDANIATNTGYYRINSGIQNMPYDGFGILLVFKALDYILQIYSGGSRILVRKASGDNVSWGDWKSVTLT